MSNFTLLVLIKNCLKKFIEVLLRHLWRVYDPQANIFSKAQNNIENLFDSNIKSPLKIN